MTRPDETWHRLREWTYGQTSSERLAAQVLLSEGFEALDPSHPLGGRDGGRDATCTRHGKKWVMAVYFPRGQQNIRNIHRKFESDFKEAIKHHPDGIAFVTNQELALHERSKLMTLASPHLIELYHLERLTAILDQPAMSAVRKQFLDINYLTILDEWRPTLKGRWQVIFTFLAIILSAVWALMWLYDQYAPPSGQAVAQAVSQLRSATRGSTPPELDSAIRVLRRAKTSLGGESFAGAWLVCQDLSRLDLRRIDASRLHGTGAHFVGSLVFLGNFEGSELNVSSFQDADLESANFDETNLIGASFRNANARNATARHTTFQAADLSGATFSGADLSNSNLMLADLRSVNLERAKLDGVVMESTDLSGANLTDATYLTQEMLNHACARLSEPPVLSPGFTPPPTACDIEPQQSGQPPERAIKKALLRFVATQEVIQGSCNLGHNEPTLFDRNGHAIKPVFVPFEVN